MKSLDDYRKNSERISAEAGRRQRSQEYQRRMEQHKLDQRRNYTVGALVVRYFPGLKAITPGRKGENAQRFARLRDVLQALASSPEFTLWLGEQCVSGQREIGGE